MSYRSKIFGVQYYLVTHFMVYTAMNHNLGILLKDFSQHMINTIFTVNYIP